jgi:hypothetical protein
MKKLLVSRREIHIFLMLLVHALMLIPSKLVFPLYHAIRLTLGKKYVLSEIKVSKSLGHEENAIKCRLLCTGILICILYTILNKN